VRRPDGLYIRMGPEQGGVQRQKAWREFDEATAAFGDPLALLMPDPDHSTDELRYVVLGMSNRQRLLVVAFAERPPRTRVISARRARRREWRRYEEEG
jgi:uncharacterized protein